MSLVAQAIIEGAHNQVFLGGLWWRLSTVNTAALIKAGGTVALVAHNRAPKQGPTTEEIDEVVTFSDSVNIAGVVAAAPDVEGKPGAWEPVSLVAERKDEDAAAGRVWVGSLSIPLRRELATAILQIALEGGAAAERIARFLGGQQGAAGCGGEPVRG